MAHKLLDGATAKGASEGVKVGETVTHHQVTVNFQHNGATVLSALVVVIQGSHSKTKTDTGVIFAPALVVSGTDATQVAFSAFDYKINGTSYSKAADTDHPLTAGNTVGASKFGIVNLYIDTAGTVTDEVPIAAQTYATAILAIAAGQALLETKENIPKSHPNKCYIGSVLISNGVALWTADTDDMTDASDVTTAVFMDAIPNYINMRTYTFSADEIIAQQALFWLSDMGMKYIRGRIKTITGDGKVNLYYTPLGGSR